MKTDVELLGKYCIHCIDTAERNGEWKIFCDVKVPMADPGGGEGHISTCSLSLPPSSTTEHFLCVNEHH